MSSARYEPIGAPRKGRTSGRSSRIGLATMGLALTIALSLFTVHSGALDFLKKFQSGEEGYDSLVLPGREGSRGALSAVGLKDSLRTNLRQDKGYLLSWSGESGWTNALFTQFKHVHIAKLSNRIPIILPTLPHNGHLNSLPGHDALPIPWSDIFDLGRLRKELGIPVLEMEDLKGESYSRTVLPSTVKAHEQQAEYLAEIGDIGTRKRDHEDYDVLGCWSLSMTSQNNSRNPQYFDGMRLKLSFTPIPARVLTDPERQPPNGYAIVPDLAEMMKYYSYDDPDYHKTLRPDQELVKLHKQYDPNWELPEVEMDERVSCIDTYTYYTLPSHDWTGGAQWMLREDFPGNSWTQVGTHVHWLAEVQDLADEYLRKAFGLAPGTVVPNYMSVHIRRTDLLFGCHDQNGVPDPACLSADLFKQRVEEIKGRLRERGDVVSDYIIFTTDDPDPAYRAALKAVGMSEVDHDAENTIEKYGIWWPTILDAVFLSGGKGFVGTSGSTMSEIAVRRVEDWRNGIAIQIQHGERVTTHE